MFFLLPGTKQSYVVRKINIRATGSQAIAAILNPKVRGLFGGNDKNAPESSNQKRAREEDDTQQKISFEDNSNPSTEPMDWQPSHSILSENKQFKKPKIEVISSQFPSNANFPSSDVQIIAHDESVFKIAKEVINKFSVAENRDVRIQIIQTQEPKVELNLNDMQYMKV